MNRARKRGTAAPPGTPTRAAAAAGLARTFALRGSRHMTFAGKAGDAGGRCACGGRWEGRTVRHYRFEDEFGRVTAADNVPARVCRRCGDVRCDPRATARIEARVARAPIVPRRGALGR